MWPTLDPQRLDESFNDLLTVSALVTRAGRGDAGNLAAEYLSDFGLTDVQPMRTLDAERFSALMRINSVVAIKKAMIRGVPLLNATNNAFVTSSGVVSRLIMDAGRERVMDTTVRDPESRGWQRVTSGGCEFCQMLAGRGATYTEESAAFESHAHCGCTAEPVF